MKRILISALTAAIILLTVPAALCGGYISKQHEVGEASTSPSVPESTPRQNEDSAKGEVADEKIRVWFPKEKQTREMSLRDYLICTTAGEMPAAYELQALCAQALASSTLVRRLIQQGNRVEGSDNAVVVADSAVNQAFMSEDEMKSRWGNDYEKWHKKLEQAVDTVIGYEIVYNGEPILAAFHAISFGMTEDAESVWGKHIPYLTGVESNGDKLAPKYSSTVTLSETDIKKSLGVTSDKTGRELIRDARYTSSGTLMSVTIGEKSFTGEAIRKALSLRSSGIRFSFNSDGTVTLSVVGYGHGVGLSQYGADYYARQGYGWREIIAHYYPDTQIKELNAT